MKHQFVVQFVSGVLFCAALAGCAGFSNIFQKKTPRAAAESAQTKEPSLDDIKDIIWILTEARLGYGSLVLDRGLLARNGFEEFFSLQFTDEGINGTAAPNRYFAQFNVQEGTDATIYPIASTKIMARTSLGVLDETEFFKMLQTMKCWVLQDDALYILAANAVDGSGITLVFKKPE